VVEVESVGCAAVLGSATRSLEGDAAKPTCLDIFLGVKSSVTAGPGPPSTWLGTSLLGRVDTLLRKIENPDAELFLETCL